MTIETIEDDDEFSCGFAGTTHPGLVVIYSGERPQCLVLPLVNGAIELGRDELAAAGIPDGRVSRSHLRVERADALWIVRDLGSRNGTFVDGRQVQRARLPAPIVRIGRTLLLPVPDYRPFRAPGVVVGDGVVMGPQLAAAHAGIARIARSGANLLVRGESGSGKELAAAAFHAAAAGASERRDASRPLVAVNCATIPRELAERTLFGACRGAYTGAVADTVGLVQAADGGTLFLDEIAELDTGVQAKLLRVLETKKVLPLGGVKPVAVDVRLCAATLKNLRGEVTAGRFREDLYFRIGRPALVLPPLRERREEIPWHVERALEALPPAARLTASAEFVEACLLRAWPGNVRELLAEVTTAAVAAKGAQRSAIAASDLDDEAGCALGDAAEAAEPSAPSSSRASNVEERGETPLPDPAAIEAALRAEQGNVARAAARLAISRARLRRFIERQGIDVRSLRSG